MRQMKLETMALTLIPILIAAFSYPLGNRKVMSLVSSDISTLERVYAMTLCSLPVWIFLSIWAFITHGLPGRDHLIQSFFVALFSGTAATVLFFKATDMVKHNHKWLAVIEATQSGEVIFHTLRRYPVFKRSCSFRNRTGWYCHYRSRHDRKQFMPVNKKLTLLKNRSAFCHFNYIVSIFTLFISFLYTCSTNHGSVDFPSASSGENQATPLFSSAFTETFSFGSASNRYVTFKCRWLDTYLPFLHDHRQ